MEKNTAKVDSDKLILSKNEYNQLKKLASNEEEEQNKLHLEADNKIEETLADQRYKYALARLEEFEAERKGQDKILIQEKAEHHKKVIERLRLIQLAKEESSKMMTSEERKNLVLKERALQIAFNEAKRKKAQEKERLFKMEQNAEIEKYKRNQLEEKKRLAAIKKENNAILLNELKIRENLRRDEKLRKKNEDIAELQLINQEIQNNKKEKQAKIQAQKKIVEENRKLIAIKNEMRHLKEEELTNISVAEAFGMKTKIMKQIQLMEIKKREEKQKMLEKFAEKTQKLHGDRPN